MIDKIKRDSEENWKKAKNFIPKLNEIIIYDCDTTTRIKIGDGITKVNDLKFAEEELMSMTIYPELNNSKVENEILVIGEKN